MYKVYNSKIQQDTQIYGWTLALQTFSVLKIDKLYNTKIRRNMDGRWRSKLVVSLK